MRTHSAAQIAAVSAIKRAGCAALSALILLGTGCGGARVSPVDSQVIGDVADAALSDSTTPADTVEPPTDQPSARSDDGAVTADATGDASASVCVGMAPLGGVRTINVLSGGVMRSAQLFVPMTYDPTRAYPVVLGFHGYLEDPNAFARESSLDRRGPEHGYITVLPAGLNNSWNAGACCGTSRANNVNDVQFVRDLIAWLRSHACIDRRRIFATGFSNGGMLSHRLACELSDQIAAVAPTSGVIVTQNCAPSRPISVLHSHGTRDLVVPYNGSPVLQFPPVVDTMRGWASRNLCEMSLQEIFNRGDARCVRYPNCRDGVETIRCDVANGGHTWPGGNNIAAAGYTSRDLDATAFILDFFDRHPLP